MTLIMLTGVFSKCVFSFILSGCRGVMDLSSSAVVKRHLIEPIKLDANIKRSLQPSCQDVPILECSATLDFVKVCHR